MGPKMESLERAPRSEARNDFSLRQVISEDEAAASISGQATLINPAGLHFGPAVQFVQLAASHQAEISVVNLATGAGPANAKRFNQVLSLGAEQGHDIADQRAGTRRPGGGGRAAGV